VEIPCSEGLNSIVIGASGARSLGSFTLEISSCAAFESFKK